MTQEDFFNKYLSDLNEQQREAAQTVDGAILLLAVPGSGKTTVLVKRLGYMVCCREIAPDSILTTTYTKAATREMQQRFDSIFGSEYAEPLEFHTINSLSVKIIGYYSRNHGRQPTFQLLDNDGELTRMIRQIYKKLNNEYAAESTIKDIRTAITYIKNIMLTEDEINSYDVGVPKMPEIFRQYREELIRIKRMDYDDQMVYALTILKSYPEVLKYFQEKYRYICVDESQDTSKIQHTIIRLLAQKYGNIFMVGDEDQSIYGFRAAYPEALMNFGKDYPNAKVLLIDHNYRSTKEIAAAANAFVSKNRFRLKKKVIIPTRGSGFPVQVINTVDCSTQYQYLFNIAKSCDTETAVLFRNNDSALPLIDMLERSSLAYNCRSFDEVFFSHQIVVDITDIINFAYNPLDAEAFMRVFYKFVSFLTRDAAVYACEQSNRTGKPILEELVRFQNLNGHVKEDVITLMQLLPMITESSGTKAVQLIRDRSGYGQYVISKKMEVRKFEILSILAEHEVSPRNLLRRLSELRDIIQNHTNSSSNRFILSTIHSSKGMEYDRVFLLDIFDGVMPSKAVPDALSQDEIKQYEEDRRLYYVGMTRAKNELYLFNCRNSDSAFTSEVLRSLPKEVIDKDSVLYLFKQNLCDRTYKHKDEGKGIVTAQCGNSVLVKYENGKTQLLTISQLFEQRDIAAAYKAVPEKEMIHPAAKTESLLSKMAPGRPIKHRIFGEGVIETNDGTYITIRFTNAIKEKFDLKESVKNGLFQIRK